MHCVSPSDSAPTIKIALPAPREHGWILEIQDDSETKRVPIDGTMVIGARASADIVVEDATVSGAHLEASPLPDGLILRDLDSTNGTWTGGARVTELWATEG